MILRLRSFAPKLALGALLSCALVGCTTEATPMPEPPSLDPTKIGSASGINPVTLAINGAPGAAPSGATVRVTDLDERLAPQVVTARGDGSFQVPLLSQPGNELRFQAVVDARRGEPADFVVQSTSTLLPSDRHSCVRVLPGLAVTLDARETAAQISIENRCSSALSFDSATFRLGLPDVALTTPLPATIAPAQRLSLEVSVPAGLTNEVEEVLFVEISVDGRPIRYPFTIYRTAAP